MDKKTFLTIDMQIERIRSLGIGISNPSDTRKNLMENSYYNIMNGYRGPFLFNNQPNKFIRGTQFTELYGLYHFDRQLRDTLFSFLLEAENKIKTQVVYEFLSCVDTDGNLLHESDGYLQVKNYDCGTSVQFENTRSVIELIATLQKTIAKSFRESDAISHYLTKYGYVPLWVLATRMTFGDVCSFYECMSSSNRQAVARQYKMPDNDLATILRLLAFARNHCAHGNRMYCLKKKTDLPKPDATIYPIESRLIAANLGKHNLLNVYIALRYIISPRRYTELIKRTRRLMDDLASRLNSIPIQNIEKIVGFTKELNEMTI